MFCPKSESWSKDPGSVSERVRVGENIYGNDHKKKEAMGSKAQQKTENRPFSFPVSNRLVSFSLQSFFLSTAGRRFLPQSGFRTKKNSRICLPMKVFFGEGSLCQNYAVKMKRREEIRNAFVLKTYILLSLSTPSLQPFDFRLVPLSAHWCHCLLRKSLTLRS